jgi:electron transport complex protein RnfC
MILQKASGIHIEGKKSLSKKMPLKEYLDPKTVYIPLVQQACPLKRIVEIGDLVAIGQVIALREGFGEMPIHASISGKVTGIKKVWHASGRMVEAIEIENDFENRLDASIKPETNPDLLTREQLVDKMKQAGLVGLGGAGFPTYLKYCTKCPIDMVIINAVECEPYMTCDCLLTEKYAEKLLKGLKYMMKAAGASKGYVAYKTYNQTIRTALEPLLVKYQGIQLQPIKDIYPSGWEKYIVEQITNKTYKKLPSEIGVIVNNSQTAIVFGDVVEHNIPLVSRVISITGEGITNPQNFYVPLGTKVQDLVALCGGYAEGLDPKNAWYIAGGPMTGRAILIDELVVSDTLGAVVVIPTPPEKHHPECLGCGQCADVCPVHLTPTEIKRAFDRKDQKAIAGLFADKCMACGLCSYVCPSHIEIADYVAKAKDLLKKGV